MCGNADPTRLPTATISCDLHCTDGEACGNIDGQVISAYDLGETSLNFTANAVYQTGVGLSVTINYANPNEIFAINLGYSDAWVHPNSTSFTTGEIYFLKEHTGTGNITNTFVC
ncbi:uncharacterized protein [Palaemon carinicauda]|uniref:uncharacterized protein n=1 Tax=Palaemon carinicauda TaxID=392227 RepID=UPI0035B61759